ncbi:YqjF family protein [Riemerella anatipestifer]|uniref:YqjF family protein n=1 Tax=Riemerella anatipestifer TaxID=34085 RepID=UPI003DA8B41D
MNTIKEILKEISHRPFEIPKGNWVYYQEWNKALFLHWIVPFELLREYVPNHLYLDTFKGNCYISLVAFTMEKIRPRFLPSIKCISDFDEVNLRTYVYNGNKRGVYFLNIEAGKSVSSFIAKVISGLPYEKSTINRTDGLYSSINSNKGFRLHAEYEIEETISDKTELDKWLTERYCLYLDKENIIYRYDIHHKEWEIKKVAINSLNVNYKIGEIDLSNRQPNLTHYSEGIKVIAWKREPVYE